MKFNTLLLALTAGAIIVFVSCLLKKNDESHTDEHYEPQNMGSRKYWGWGREYGWSQGESHQDRYFCYPASQREFWNCLPGYSLKKDAVTGFLQCCVNELNY